MKRPKDLSDEQWHVLQTAVKHRDKKSGRVPLQTIYKKCPIAMSDNSIVRKVGKLVKGGFLARVRRGMYRVVAA